MDEFEITEIADQPFFTAEFGKDIAKAVIISAATTVGMVAGLYAVGAGMTWWQKRKDAKKVIETETTETTN